MFETGIEGNGRGTWFEFNGMVSDDEINQLCSELNKTYYGNFHDAGDWKTKGEIRYSDESGEGFNVQIVPRAEVEEFITVDNVNNVDTLGWDDEEYVLVPQI